MPQRQFWLIIGRGGVFEYLGPAGTLLPPNAPPIPRGRFRHYPDEPDVERQIFDIPLERLDRITGMIPEDTPDDEAWPQSERIRS